MRNSKGEGRPNLAMAIVVEEGIKRAELEGRTTAATFLLGASVPFRVIVRVLQPPGGHRQARSADLAEHCYGLAHSVDTAPTREN